MSPWPPMPAHLSTARLELGPWRDDDLDRYVELVGERDPRAAAAPRGGHPTRAEMRDTVTRQQEALAVTGLTLYALRVVGEFIGYGGLTPGHSTVDEPEIAYELLARQQGQGYATEAGRAVVEVAAGTGRHRIWATVRPWNMASLGVLDKLGFERTNRSTTDDYGESRWYTRSW